MEQRVYCEDYYIPLGNRASGSLAITCGKNTRDPFGQPPKAMALGVLSRGSGGLDLPSGVRACRKENV